MTMTCAACERHLGDYLDGGLDVYTLARVERHLAACAACRDALEALRATEQTLNAASRAAALEPAPNFTFAVMAELRAMPRPHVQPVLRWAFLGWYLLTAWVAIGVLAVAAHPVLLAGIGALARAGNAALAVVQATIGAVGAITDGHSALIAVAVAVVLALDAVLATGLYLFHTVFRARVLATLTAPAELEQA